MKLVEWLAKEVTDDPRALRWFAEPGTRRADRARIPRAARGLPDRPGRDPQDHAHARAGRAPGLGRGERDRLLLDLRAPLPAVLRQVDIAYVPGDRILGLGKLPRLVDALARRFQIQEDLVREVAHVMMEHGRARGVRVRARAQHLCMCSRGPASQSSITHTEFALGTLDEG